MNYNQVKIRGRGQNKETKINKQTNIQIGQKHALENIQIIYIYILNVYVCVHVCVHACVCNSPCYAEDYLIEATPSSAGPTVELAADVMQWVST